MTNLTVVGTQWGDEGKGKVVDWLAEKADVIARFQGGNNAGHTLVVGDKVFKLSLLPSGIVREGKICVIGSGVVIDPTALIKEVKSLREYGVKIDEGNLIIADNVSLILPFHKELDHINEESSGKNKIGTTKRGIGPSYEDKIARRAIRICDLQNEEILDTKLEKIISYHNVLRKGANVEEIKISDVKKYLSEVKDVLLSYAQPVWRVLQKFDQEGKNILCEGAQGLMLDVEHGTYPFVTSSCTQPANAISGTGYGGFKNNEILGITKAYVTRVGSGPFPTELSDETGEILGDKGKEFGTVTGRQRRCGWFDAVLTKQAVEIAGIDYLAITKLDVLDEFAELKVCVAYEHKGERYGYLPNAQDLQSGVKPIYKTLPGWQSSTYGIKKYSDLPENAKKYVEYLSDFIGIKTALISTGPERESTILLEGIFGS